MGERFLDTEEVVRSIRTGPTTFDNKPAAKQVFFYFHLVRLDMPGEKNYDLIRIW